MGERSAVAELEGDGSGEGVEAEEEAGEGGEEGDFFRERAREIGGWELERDEAEGGVGGEGEVGVEWGEGGAGEGGRGCVK